MGYRSMRQCVTDLESAGHLVRLDDEVDAHLEAAEIQRRVYQSGGPAVLMTRVKDCRFPMVCNLFGSLERARFLFRDTLEQVRRLIELKTAPQRIQQQPGRYWRVPFAALHTLPRGVRRGPVLDHSVRLSELPQLKSWPDDGGAFITLPQVYTEQPGDPGLRNSNLGMYRVQLSGGRYEVDREVGLHYQIHRGIGVHHQAAMERGERLRVNIFVGGTPAMTLAAVMPLPEGMSELTFAGALAGHRIPMIRRTDQAAVYADADFCISGTVDLDRQLPEGPFGDHLGYYSLAHEFPVLRVDRVTHRADAIWPFTVVGRPPQEDTTFGRLIHELTGPVIPTIMPGILAVHAVDAAGVHPLLLAIGSERYVPYQSQTKPRELLTQANAILGQGQMSLAKYVFIVNQFDDPALRVDDIGRFLQHLLRRIDWRRDVHFQTRTTIDTLDYSGSGLNEGSKVVFAAAGPVCRELPTEMPSDLALPDGFDRPRICLPGILAVSAARATHGSGEDNVDLRRFCDALDRGATINQFPLVVLVDDSDFTARTLENFLWVVFTRSNPAADIDGVESGIHQKHWSCNGSLVIDARTKPQHAPPLVEDLHITRRVDALAARGGPLAKYL